MPSPLFAIEPVAPDHRAPPVVVVGLPRSGSSFLSHVLSSLEDWYVFDDLYLHRQARAMKALGPLSQEQLAALVDFLGWQVRARIKYEEDFSKPQCSLEDVDLMGDALLQTFTGRAVLWHELMEEWLVRLALHHGRTRWGYKAPQDFMHMDELAGLFPGIRFVFIVRDPRETMCSFKYVDGEDGSPGQYHPWVYARYWRMANADALAKARKLDLPLIRVRFEDLVADPTTEGRRLAAFLGTSLRDEIRQERSNSSFRRGPRRSLTETERYICERVAGDVMDAEGYTSEGARPRLRDALDLIRTTLRFSVHQAIRLLREPAARGSVRSFLSQLFRRA